MSPENKISKPKVSNTFEKFGDRILPRLEKAEAKLPSSSPELRGLRKIMAQLKSTGKLNEEQQRKLLQIGENRSFDNFEDL